MIEILKIIVLACQVSGGNTYQYIKNHQIKCQKELIACMDSKGDIKESLLNWSPANLRDCLKERK